MFDILVLVTFTFDNEVLTPVKFAPLPLNEVAVHTGGTRNWNHMCAYEIAQ